jgi:hypothetical protein
LAAVGGGATTGAAAAFFWAGARLVVCSIALSKLSTSAWLSTSPLIVSFLA